MTYLEAVNQVLQRLREDTVTDVTGLDDPVAEMVVSLVNDAKQLVEDAHTWNALRSDWAIATTAGDNLYSLTNAGNYGKIEYIVKDDGTELTEETFTACANDKLLRPPITNQNIMLLTVLTLAATFNYSSSRNLMPYTTTPYMVLSVKQNLATRLTYCLYPVSLLCARR